MEFEKDQRLSEIFKDHYKMLMFTISRRVTNFDDALDICQEVCTAFYAQYRFEDPETMTETRAKALLMGIILNKIADYYKNRTNSPMFCLLDNCEEALDTLQTKNDSVERIVIRRQILREIQEDLQKDGEPWKNPLILHAIVGFSYDEISQMLDVPPQVLRTRVCRYRKELREKYRDYDKW